MLGSNIGVLLKHKQRLCVVLCVVVCCVCWFCVVVCGLLCIVFGIS